MTKSARGDDRSDDRRRTEELDVEAQLLKESLGAGLAAAAIFAGSTQAAPYPVPSPPGTADAAAELALIPKKGEARRGVQQAKPKATAPKKAAKAKKATKAKRVTGDGPRGGRPQPQ